MCRNSYIGIDYSMEEVTLGVTCMSTAISLVRFFIVQMNGTGLYKYMYTLLSMGPGDWVICCIGGDEERKGGESREKVVILARLSCYPDAIIGIGIAAKSHLSV
jgi:hypothetical protein